MKAMILLFCLLPALASAGNLYRCVNHAGHVSYQSERCPSGARTDRTIKFTQASVSQSISVLSVVSDKRDAPKSRNGARRKSAGSGRKPKPSPCARAKAKRELQLQRLGFKRTFDDLSRIDSAVRAVCKEGY